MSSVAAKKPTACARLATGMTSIPSTTAASAALSAGTTMPAQARLLARRPSPSRARPSPAASCRRAPARRRRRTARTAPTASCPLPASMPERDRQIERRRLLRQLGRGQVDDDAVLRADEAAVDHRPLDAVRALLDRRFGQADEDRLGQRARRDVDLDLDRQGVDARGAKRCGAWRAWQQGTTEAQRTQRGECPHAAAAVLSRVAGASASCGAVDQER